MQKEQLDEYKELLAERDRYIKEIKEMRDFEEYQVRELKVLCEIRENTKRFSRLYYPIDEEYMDTIYEKNPLAVELNAEVSFHPEFEKGFLEACKKFHWEHKGVSARYVVHCEAVMCTEEDIYVTLSDPFRTVCVPLLDEEDMENAEYMVDRMLVVLL